MPQRPGVIRASIVVVLQIGHSGRTWNDMMLALDQAGAQHSQSPGGCRYKAGDEDSLLQRAGEQCSKLLTFTKKLTIGSRISPLPDSI